MQNIKTTKCCTLKLATAAKSHAHTLTFVSQKHRVALWQEKGHLAQSLTLWRIGELISAKVLLQNVENEETLICC